MTSLTTMARRRLGSDDSGFALIYAVLLITVIALMSTAVLALVIQQVKPTQFAKKRELTLNAAEAGLEASLNTIRNSLSAGAGNIGKLPQCTAAHPAYAALAGTVDASTSSSYADQIYYLKSNPSGIPFSTDSSSAFYGLLVPCTPLQKQPLYAYVVSNGTGNALPGKSPSVGNRTLHATYQFATVNNQTSGGRAWSVQNSSFCWDVTSMPAVNTSVKLQPCGPLYTPSQSFTYEPDLTYRWTGDTTVTPILCLTRNLTNTPTLQQCGAPASSSIYSPIYSPTYPFTGTPAGTAPIAGSAGALQQNQEWGIDANGNVASLDSNGHATSPCFAASGGTFAANTQMVMGSCGGTADYEAINSDPQLGAGAAVDPGTAPTGRPSIATAQLTNFLENGRCLDISAQDVSRSSEIMYPCKEEAQKNPGNDWNQEWTFVPTASGGSTGTLSTPNHNATDGKSQYCLDSTSSSTWVTVQLCNGTGLASDQGVNDLDAGQLFTFTGNIAGDYGDSFEITNLGKCLSIDQVNKPYAPWSTPFMESCNQSLRQKWNAPPGPVKVNLSDVSEQQHS